MKEAPGGIKVAYFKRLSPYEHKGPSGQPLVEDPPEDVIRKAEKLAEWIKQSKHLVCLTGAGISTGAGIRDFRGPNGVWTLEDRGIEIPSSEATSTAFEAAQPTFTHLALLELFKAGKLKYLISQNVDGLHLRSGFPGESLGELHGNLFTEWCQRCKISFMRDSDVGGVGLKETPNPCPKCGQLLHDTVLDWDTELPEETLKESRRHSRLSDLVLCLGTSLRIEPAGGLPFLNLKDGKRVAICNLQETPKDKKAHMLLHGRVDEVMRVVMDRLGIQVPEFVPPKRLFLTHHIEKGLLVVVLASDGLMDPAWVTEAEVAVTSVSPSMAMTAKERLRFEARVPPGGSKKGVLTVSLRLRSGEKHHTLDVRLTGERGFFQTAL